MSARLGPRIAADSTCRGPRHVSATRAGSIPGFRLAPLSPVRHVAAPYRSLARVNFPPRFRIASFGLVARASPAKHPQASPLLLAASHFRLWNRAASIHRPSPRITQTLSTLWYLCENTLGLSLSSSVSSATAVPAGDTSLPLSNGRQARTSPIQSPS